MMKLIFVTWGVISWLGKWITAASIGRILKSSGYTISMIKMDPYLQVDAGTMSPYEHGEVFVTNDGGEIDLDFGHYERFVHAKLTKANSITTGKVYQHVINKEREGAYLWETVQVIPHVINEIKEMISSIAQETDVTIIEIGGTVWDIEGPHFIETMRQLRYDLWVANTFFVHVVPIIHLSHSGELKTKAIQHSIVKLREVGISPDCLVVRTPEKLEEKIIEKLSLFGGLPVERIIQGTDQESIYNVPLAFNEQGIGTIIEQHLFSQANGADLTEWKNLCDRLLHAPKETVIALAGKYTQFKDCDLSVMESLKHAGVHLNTKVTIVPLYTADYEGADRKQKLQHTIDQMGIDGILIPWWFGERGVEGKINIASYAMDKKIPYLWICLWLQTAVIAHARNNCGLTDAHTTEINEHTKNPLIHLMHDQRDIKNKGGTMRLWAYPAVLHEWTKVFDVYKTFHPERFTQENIVMERHRHRYEVNPDYHQLLRDNGMVLSWLSPDGQLVEFIEMKDHPYFLATQAHPEFLSKLDQAHPLFVGLVKASMEK